MTSSASGIRKTSCKVIHVTHMYLHYLSQQVENNQENKFLLPNGRTGHLPNGIYYLYVILPDADTTL
ncbi:hypothetical protein QW71_02440 [Paenibacillus sp. IHB B 3415]|nr:hypothetical protein QW71_02440 [Paenibacillus sp. IHB B 3415]